MVFHSKTSAKQQRSAVLSLCHDSVEWFEPSSTPGGVARYARRAISGHSPEELADAAVEVITAAGSQSRSCLLALGSGMVEQRTLAIPEVGRADLAKIFVRKAAALLDAAPEDTLFAALPLVGEVKDASAAGQVAECKWLVVAMRRGYMLELRLALRKRGFKIKRVVAARLARLCAAEAARGESDSAAIVIDVEQDGVVVSLIAQGTLRHQNRLVGAFEAVPTMALSLLQEIKSFDAFWRKLSRGTVAAHVVVIGLDPDRSPLFARAIASALPDAKVIVMPEEGSPWTNGPTRAVAGRLESLQATTSEGPYNLDLTVHITAPHAYIAVLAACLLSITGGFGSLLHYGLSREVAQLSSSTVSLEQLAGQLETLHASNTAAAKAVADLSAECERLVVVGERGLPLELALRDCVAAFDQRAILMSFAGDCETGEARFAGVVERDPLRSTRALTEIGAQLEHSPFFKDLKVDPPRVRSGNVSDARGLQSFDAQGLWETKL